MEPEQTTTAAIDGEQNGLDIGLALELDAELFHLLTSNDSTATQVRSTIEQNAAAFISMLGIPGILRLEIRILAESSAQAADSKDMRAEQLLRLSIHGQVYACADDLLRSVYSYMESSLLLFQATPAYILSWLKKLLDDAEGMEGSDGVSRVAEFFGLVCVEILKIRPSVLLSPAQVAQYCTLLTSSEEVQDTTAERKQPQQDWLFPVLCLALDAYLSIADVQFVSTVLSTAIASEASTEDTGEALIASLLAHNIEIRMPHECLKELTTNAGERDKFTKLRKELFDEFGIRYPAFHFVPDNHLKPSCFAFKLNAITSLPFVGLKAQQGLLRAPVSTGDNDTPMIVNPLSGVVESLTEYKLEGGKSSSSQQLDYIILCFKATLKKHKALFVQRNFVAEQCRQLGMSYPTLVNTVKAKISDEQLTRILRALVMENIPLKDWHFLLERLLDYLYISADPANNSILAYWMTTPPEKVNWSYELENIVSFLTESMKRTDILRLGSV